MIIGVILTCAIFDDLILILDIKHRLMKPIYFDTAEHRSH